MKILFGKTFGIGNAILSIPAIKALSTLGEVDLLIGTGPDDFGARAVLENLMPKYVSKIYFDSVSLKNDYDVAVMSIPFDGRWQNSKHYMAKKVLDQRSRPDATTMGFSSWEKHEVEYQMEAPRELGFVGETPDLSFRKESILSKSGIYLGIGFKKDLNGFWQKKHWGNENYARFITEVCRLRKDLFFKTTGNEADIENTIGPIISSIKKYGQLVFMPTFGLERAFDVVSSSVAYFGNDTGMMHVAASYNVPVFGMFGFDTAIKNPPLCSKNKIHMFNSVELSPEEIAVEFIDFLERKNND